MMTAHIVSFFFVMYLFEAVQVASLFWFMPRTFSNAHPVLGTGFVLWAEAFAWYAAHPTH